MPPDVFDIDEAFIEFRDSAASLAPCANTVQLRDTQNNPIPGNAPPSPNTPVRLELTPGVQNVLAITAASLANISEITFVNQPSVDTPLLVNVDTSGVGNTFSWVSPNTPGISGAQAPFILWNFPTATSVTMPPGGGATIEGTLFAPNADVAYLADHNIEGNVIARTFVHTSGAGPVGVPRELHYFPFSALLTPCDDVPPTTTTTTTTTTSSSTTTSTTTTTTSVPDSTTTTSTASTTTTSSPTSTSTTTSTVPAVATTTTVDQSSGGGSLPSTGSSGVRRWITMGVLATVIGAVALALARPREPRPE